MRVRCDVVVRKDKQPQRYPADNKNVKKIKNNNTIEKMKKILVWQQVVSCDLYLRESSWRTKKKKQKKIRGEKKKKYY